jgi:hypothetical protein
LTHGTVVCSDGSTHRQLFADGIPNPRHRTVIQRSGVYDYHISLPAYFEAMHGRVYASHIVGRLRFAEASRDQNSQRRKCGTQSPKGNWVTFVAPRIKGPPTF